MKTLSEFKKEYNDILTAKASYEDKKTYSKKQKEALRIKNVIYMLEAGVTEELLRKQLSGLQEYIETCEESYNVESGHKRKEYMKILDCPEKQRRVKEILWILNH